MPEPALVEKVVHAVRAKRKYTKIDPAFIQALSYQECEKGWGFKETVKQVSARLHQTGSAYFRSVPDYSRLMKEIDNLPADIHHPINIAFCQRAMSLHASTAERLPILETFFHQTLAEISPISSVLDLACGFNPMAASFMPLSSDVKYHGVDIFSDLTVFIQHYLQHCGIFADIHAGDISQMENFPQIQVAFLLKTLPCLEQAYADISAPFLEKIPAKHFLISYPIRSLGGRSKGMRKTYAMQFEILAAKRPWRIQRFDFESELAFLVSR